MKHADIIQKLNLEQKCALLSGETVFTTRALPGKGIPAITLSDGPNGVRKQAGAADHLGLNPSVPATCFPTSSATACSWDEKLGEAVGEALGEEAAAQEVAVLLGPGLNIQRSPLCGRDFEYFSEDPILAGRMAAAYVRGIQKNGIAACPKHFAVNSQELRRMASDSVLDERTLRELYLTGFEIVVKEAKPKTIMTSYNLINGTYANENAHLLQDILRKDWDFDGAVVTDWGGSNDHALGVKNGSTLEMPCPGGDSIRELMKAVQGGRISEADVDARLDEMLELVLSTHAAVEKRPAPSTPPRTISLPAARPQRASSCSGTRAASCRSSPMRSWPSSATLPRRPAIRAQVPAPSTPCRWTPCWTASRPTTAASPSWAMPPVSSVRVQLTPRSWKRLWPSQRRRTPFCSASASMSCGRAKASTAPT